MLNGLVHKRAKIAGQIEHTQGELRKLVTSLDAIDRAIRTFDPTADVGEIRNGQFPPLHATFRGEMMRFVLGALGAADGPLTSREIADDVLTGRGRDKDDQKVAQMICRRVGAYLWKCKRAGNVRKVRIVGDFKGWVRG